MLTPSSTNPEVTRKGDYIFRSCFIDPVQGAAIAQFAARTLNAKRGALILPLERLIPDCEFVVYEGLPHNITDAVPDRCAQELKRFLLAHPQAQS